MKERWTKNINKNKKKLSSQLNDDDQRKNVGEIQCQNPATTHWAKELIKKTTRSMRHLSYATLGSSVEIDSILQGIHGKEKQSEYLKIHEKSRRAAQRDHRHASKQKR